MFKVTAFGIRRALAKLSVAAAAAAALLLPHAASPAAAGDLEDIAARGKVLIGVQAENPPWGFTGSDGELAGYDIDVAHLLAKSLGVPVEFVRVTGPNRIAQLQTGKVDILIAVVGMYPDRAEVVQFSKPYSTLSGLLYARTDLDIDGFEDLAGLRVGACRGCAEEIVITENAPEGTTIQRFDEDAHVIQAFISGQVDAVGGNNTFIAKIKQAAPDFEFEPKFVLKDRQYQGMAMRQDDKEFLRYVNNFIDQIIASGELNAISQEWLNEDIPEFPTEIPGVPFASE